MTRRRGALVRGGVRDRLGLAAVMTAVLLAGAIGLAGCSGGGRSGGLELRYERRAEPVGIAVWTVEPDGTIRYAGGRDALAGRDTWTGRLEPAAESRLRELVAALPSRLAAADARPDRESRVRTDLRVRGPGGPRRLRAGGDPPELAAILALLREASADRLEWALRRLPRPTERADDAADAADAADAEDAEGPPDRAAPAPAPPPGGGRP